MNVLKRISVVVLLAVFMSACGPKDGTVRITGSINQYINGAYVKVDKIIENGTETIETVLIDSAKLFDFKIKVDEPSFYRMVFNDRQFIRLVLTGEESKVTVHADGYNSNGFSEVSGSKYTDMTREMDDVMLAWKREVQTINQRAIDARMNNDMEAFQQASLDYQNSKVKSEQQVKKLTREALPSLAAYYGTQLIDIKTHFDFVDSMAASLHAAFPENFLMNDLMATINGLKNLRIGSMAPEIAQASPEGEVITLSSLKGNYVLVDFWAAWCKPCRVENPNVVKMYDQYKDKNFEILGVSLDRTRDAWIKAIEADGLPWKHVSDLKHFDNEAARAYQINSIPDTYLIDPEGKIIAKGLRGNSLKAKLKEIFG